MGSRWILYFRRKPCSALDFVAGVPPTSFGVAEPGRKSVGVSTGSSSLDRRADHLVKNLYVCQRIALLRAAVVERVFRPVPPIGQGAVVLEFALTNEIEQVAFIAAVQSKIDGENVFTLVRPGPVRSARKVRVPIADRRNRLEVNVAVPLEEPEIAPGNDDFLSLRIHDHLSIKTAQRENPRTQSRLGHQPAILLMNERPRRKHRRTEAHRNTPIIRRQSRRNGGSRG